MFSMRMFNPLPYTRRKSKHLQSHPRRSPKCATMMMYCNSFFVAFPDGGNIIPCQRYSCRGKNPMAIGCSPFKRACLKWQAEVQYTKVVGIYKLCFFYCTFYHFFFPCKAIPALLEQTLAGMAVQTRWKPQLEKQ